MDHEEGFNIHKFVWTKSRRKRSCFSVRILFTGQLQ